MFHFLVGGLMLVLMVSTFTQQYQYRGAINAYYGLYKGIVETSVLAFDDDGNRIYPYFDVDFLSDRLLTYFEDNLKPYCKTYTTNIRFGNYYTPKHPSKVTITIDAKMHDFSTFAKKAIFEVRENEI